MSDLGNLLKKAREQQGYSLDDVQEMTKIRKRYLEAIEEGDYKALPGSFYVRAFVKNYSDTVGLDSEEVLRLYQKEIPSPSPEPIPDQPLMRKRRASAQASDRWSKWGFRVLMWSFLALICVVIYIYALNNNAGDEPQTADNGSRITDEAQPPDTGDTEPVGGSGQPDAENGGAVGNSGAGNESEDTDTEPVTTLSFVETFNSPPIDKYAISPGGAHKYEIIVADGQKSWIELRKESRSGERVHYKTEEGPATITYDIEGTVYMNIGFTPGVEVRIDGVLLDDGDKTSKKYLFEPAA